MVRVWTLEGFGFFLTKISALKELNDIRVENQALRKRGAELMLENSELKEALLENQRLRKLLDFKLQSQLALTSAKVIGKQESGFVNSIILDVGKADNIVKDMAIVTAQGLVGKIFRVAENHSTAELLLDRNFRVGAMVQRSRVGGIIKWIEGDKVIMSEVPKRSDIKPGDVVITSGLSSIFPGGLKIGKIENIEEERQGLFMKISVEPAVDFTKLEEVFIITDHKPFTPAE